MTTLIPNDTLEPNLSHKNNLLNNIEEFVLAMIDKGVQTDSDIKTVRFESLVKIPYDEIKTDSVEYSIKFKKSWNKLKKFRNYGDAIVIRILLIICTAFFSYILACINQNKYYYLLLINNSIIVIDGIYIIFKNKVK